MQKGIDQSILGWIAKNKIINERGHPIEFDSHYFLLEPYANWFPKQVCMKSAQVGWSTLAILKTLYAMRFKKFNCIYTLPSFDDVRDFVPAKVDGMILKNPYLVGLLGKSDAIMRKEFGGNFIWYRGTHGKKAAIMHTSDLNCFEPGTEVLTKEGWKEMESVTKDDSVYTRTVDGGVELHKPYALIEKDFDGELVRFTHRSFDLGVTPDHNMYIRRRGDANYHLEKAEDLKISHSRATAFQMTAHAKWFSGRQKYFALPSLTVRKRLRGSHLLKPVDVKYQSSIYPIEPFFKFMGWYLSEGNISRVKGKLTGCVVITQSEGEYADEIRRCLTDCGFKWREYVNKKQIVAFSFADHHLAHYLKRFGNCFDKYIPDEMLAQVHALPYLLETLLKGDGCHSKDHISVVLNIASKRLADTTQIAWLRLGRMATIRPFTEKSGTVMYRVLAQSNETKGWGGHYKGKIEREKYKGKVYCLSVENHVIMVRDKKNKTPIWTGQCHDELDASKLDVVDLYASRVQASEYKGEWKFSNPIRPGGIDREYGLSDQRRWQIQCSRCQKTQHLEYKENVCKERLIYICRYCKGHLNEADRHDGVWRPDYPSRSDSLQGYHVNQLMAPWVDAKHLVYLEKTKTPGYFYNMVLGLPYIDEQEVITSDIIYNNITNKPNSQMRNAMGVDVKYREKHYVIGNHEGIFKTGIAKGPNGWKEIEELKRKYNAVLVADMNPDFYVRRKLLPMFPGTAHACVYRNSKTRETLIEWSKQNIGYVYGDRSQLIQWVVDALRDGHIKFGAGARSKAAYMAGELALYMQHWKNIYKKTTEDNMGIMQSSWEKKGDDDFVHATVYWYIAMTRVPKITPTIFRHEAGTLLSPLVFDDTIPADKIPIFEEAKDSNAWKHI